MVGRRCCAAEAAQQRGPTLQCGYSFHETALARLGGFEGVERRKCLKINDRIF